MPDPYRIPAGWERSTDPSSGMEFRFDGPSETETDVFGRLSSLVKYFSAWGINSFEGAGTHIHLGMHAWLEKQFPKAKDALRTRAESLAITYMLTRSNALRKLMPHSRQSNQFCEFPFAKPLSGLHLFQQVPSSREFWGRPAETESLTYISKVTPSWAIHNAAIFTSRPRQLFQAQYGAIINYRHLPTFEFRLFPGTGSEVLLQGYFKLVMAMFENLSKILQDENTLGALSEGKESPYCVNPYKFDAGDLIAEISDNTLQDFLRALLDSPNKAPAEVRPTSFMTTDNPPERIQVI